MAKKNEEIIEKEEISYQIIAMSNLLAKQTRKMDIEYQKLYFIALAHITDDNKPVPATEEEKKINAELKYSYLTKNYVEIDKKTLFNLMSSFDTNRYARFKKMWENLIPMTKYTFESNNDSFTTGNMITKITATRYKYKVFFETDYLPLLVELKDQGNFTRLLRSDIVKFNSKYSNILYQDLMRLHHKSTEGVSYKTKQLKDLYGLDENAYVSKSKTGKIKFNRKIFEMRTIDVAIAEINEKAQCIKNISYVKEKDSTGLIDKYVFKYDYIDPRIALDDINNETDFEEADYEIIYDSKIDTEEKQHLLNFNSPENEYNAFLEEFERLTKQK